MNCYDLTLEFLKVIDELQRVVDKKSKSNIKDHAWLDTEINKLENRMFEIKNLLKSKQV